ncbi:MAG TPA: heparinase II/III-family protein, partial [Paracoccaceae bacterium]|nr:heparinase II/III-family protein [Paracoccaceae bacterium]
ALGDGPARARAQAWVFDWIARHGAGRGPGWTPDLTGRRVIRWIHHALMLLNGRSGPEGEAFFAALSGQVRYLARRWPAAAPGLPRFEALTGLVYAGLALTGMEDQAEDGIAALARDCATGIDAQGGIPTRNPEELLEVFTLLIWAAQALTEAGRPVPAPHADAIARIAPCLRALRHADGSLARFHGGGRGLEGRLDHALAASGVRPGHPGGPAMGYIRMQGGRTSVIVDAADPPGGKAGANAHASTLAFELTSGRRPMIVSCGSGTAFGAEWRQAGRATVSHSTLALTGWSSSRLAPSGDGPFVTRAHVVLAQTGTGAEGTVLVAAHDGWSRTHGLTHRREMVLSPDGRRLSGQDHLAPSTQEEAALLAEVLRRGAAPPRFELRFHLHPEVEASVDMGGTAVSMALRSGEIWVFRPEAGLMPRLEASAYLEKGRLKPRATKQIVVSATAGAMGAVIGWTLAKAQDTPLAIRDLDRDDSNPPGPPL